MATATKSPIDEAQHALDTVTAELAAEQDALAVVVAEVDSIAAQALEIDRDPRRTDEDRRRCRDLRSRITDELGPLRNRHEREIARLRSAHSEAVHRLARIADMQDPAPLATAVATAQTEVNRLTAEMGALPGQLETAILAGDSAEIVNLRLRGQELPVHLGAARLGLIAAQRSHAEAMFSSFGPAINDADDARVAADQALLDAQETARIRTLEYRQIHATADRWQKAARRHAQEYDAAVAAHRAAVSPAGAL